jgi:hypothetical protein
VAELTRFVCLWLLDFRPGLPHPIPERPARRETDCAPIRIANLPPCRIGMEARVGAHHLSRTLKALRHDARLIVHRRGGPTPIGKLSL